MSAAEGNVLAFRPRPAAPAPEPTRRTVRESDDAETYRLATAILEEGFRLVMHHINVTIPKLNQSGVR
jgi:hypothetical protein